MDMIEAVVEKLRVLPADRQREVLDFAEFLQAKAAVPAPRPSLRGLWADLGVHLSKEDIDQTRREMWGAWMGDGDE